jgi:glycosyltransferase involved in cell wall biosynthesis
MRVAFYPSFRALTHANVSGLVSIARDVLAALEAEGHEAFIPLGQSMEWIYLRPGTWPATAAQIFAAHNQMRARTPDCWLTYHSYFRAPDIVGPVLSAIHGIPYFILEASYASKYRKQLKTWAGYHLNRLALQRARTVFLNKSHDIANMKRLLPSSQISYIAPGIRTESFPLAPAAGIRLRAGLGLENKRVVVTAAMMRPGNKEDGIAFVIDSCATLRQAFPDLHLLIVGDGPGRERLESRARERLPAAHSFAGRINPGDMYKWYQAGDVFAFPGIDEAIGMVYLEAQCCGLPVVATSHSGATEVVIDGLSGIIVPPFSIPDFASALATILGDPDLRARLGRQAREHVIQRHDMMNNYRTMFSIMGQCCSRRHP